MHLLAVGDRRYQRRLSGPLLDRVDIFVDMPRVAYEKLADLRRSLVPQLPLRLLAKWRNDPSHS